MFPLFCGLFLLTVVHGQDPRKRLATDLIDYDNKRSQTQAEMGPFWANRGKKTPTYYDEKLIVDEPSWILLKKNKEIDPFFTTRGKKPLYLKTLAYDYDEDTNNARREKRDFVASDDDNEEDAAFFAARGKKGVVDK